MTLLPGARSITPGAPRPHAVSRVPRADRRAAAAHLRRPPERLPDAAAVPRRRAADRREPARQQGLRTRAISHVRRLLRAHRHVRFSRRHAGRAPARRACITRCSRAGWTIRSGSTRSSDERRAAAGRRARARRRAARRARRARQAHAWRCSKPSMQGRHRYGPSAVGYFVVSGAAGADDVLAALLLARWAEAYDKRTGEIALDVAPLFESIGTLERCGDIMRDAAGGAGLSPAPRSARPPAVRADRLFRQQQGGRTVRLALRDPRGAARRWRSALARSGREAS